jgi:hypothetical protein
MQDQGDVLMVLVSITAMINVKIKFHAPPTPGARAIQIYATCLSQLKGPPQAAHGDVEGVITPGRR